MGIVELDFSFFEAVVFWVLAVLWLGVVLVSLFKKKGLETLGPEPKELARLFVSFSMILEILAIYWGVVYSAKTGLLLSRQGLLDPALSSGLASKLFLLVVGFMFLYVIWNKSLENIASQAEYSRNLALLTRELSVRDQQLKSFQGTLEESKGKLTAKTMELEGLTRLSADRERRISELKSRLQEMERVALQEKTLGFNSRETCN